MKEQLVKKELKDVSREEYKKLDKMGFLYEFFPEATGSYEVDVAKTNFTGVNGRMKRSLAASVTTDDIRYFYQKLGNALGIKKNFVKTTSYIGALKSLKQLEHMIECSEISRLAEKNKIPCQTNIN